MKLSDVLLILTLSLLSIGSFFAFQRLQAAAVTDDGVAVVVFRNQPILRISLYDDTHEVLIARHVLSVDRNNDHFVVEGVLGPVTIERANGMVRVIDETSPQNICQFQGATNSRLKPLTCLPNEVIIRIESDQFNEDEEDAILS